MDASTHQIVDFALSTEYSSLDTGTVHECKRRLIDTFACAMGSYDHPLSVSTRQLAQQYSGQATASLWGSTDQTTPEMAAFANGVMLRVGENSDTYIGHGGGGHPSDMIAALVAAAESSEADGGSLIAATVVAYDVYCRLMEAINVGAKGWDQAVHVVLGAVLGAGKLMGLTREQLGHAVSLALTPNMALRQTRHGSLSHWKGVAGANASRNAVFAALLAKGGMEGPSSIFEGKQGLWSVVGPFAWPTAPQFLSTRMVTRTSIKSLPVCYHTQSAALGALDLHGQVQQDEVESVLIQTYRTAIEMAAGDAGQWAPRSSESADHSLPFVVATALAHGVVAGTSFLPDRLDDARVQALMRKVKVTEDPALTSMWPETAAARVTVVTKSGGKSSAEVLYPKGHVSNPMNDAELGAKFLAMAEMRQGTREGAGEMALSALWRIESSKDIASDVLSMLQLR